MKGYEKMAQFNGLTLTAAGIDMISKSQGSGLSLKFTTFRLGSGQLAEGENIKALTSLKQEMLIAPVTDYTDNGDGSSEIVAVINNTAVETGFFSRELGIYAKLGDDGAEMLYAYTNCGNYADYMPDKKTPIDENEMHVTLVVSDAKDVTAIINSSVTYCTIKKMNETLDAHDKNENAHSETINKHNKDTNAHPGIFVAILGAVMKGILYLVDPADDSNDNQGATTGWVRRMFKTMLTAALNASGVQYNLAQNGFIKLGEFFGGFCLQWGRYYIALRQQIFEMPIAVSSIKIILALDCDSGCDPLGAAPLNNHSFTAWNDHIPANGGTNSYFYWFAICN